MRALCPAGRAAHRREGPTSLSITKPDSARATSATPQSLAALSFAASSRRCGTVRQFSHVEPMQTPLPGKPPTGPSPGQRRRVEWRPRPPPDPNTSFASEETIYSPRDVRSARQPLPDPGPLCRSVSIARKCRWPCFPASIAAIERRSPYAVLDGANLLFHEVSSCFGAAHTAHFLGKRISNE